MMIRKCIYLIIKFVKMVNFKVSLPFSLFSLLVVVLIFNHLNLYSQDLTFQKINSGTRAPINSIYICRDQSAFFFTDRIYRLENEEWKRINLPVEGRIGCFYPVSSDDYWYSIDQLNYTTILYHRHDGINENIRSPFANYISFIFGITARKVFFTSIGDMAIYENAECRSLPSLPVTNSISKISGNQSNSLWGLTMKGEVYLFENESFKCHLFDKPIDNYCFADNSKGFLISEDQLLQFSKSGIKKIIVNPAFKLVNKMQILADESLLMAGKNGLLLRYFNGTLLKQDLVCSESLLGIASNEKGEIWICGENGRLLYHGDKKFPAYIADNQGFSSQKLINYGINTDDEYGVAIADFNGDEKPDIYAVRIYEQNKLYINNMNSPNSFSQQPAFFEEALKRNADGSIETNLQSDFSELKLGISAADIDNDGDEDIYLCYLNSNNKLLLNQGKGIFRNVSSQKNRACENMMRSSAAAFADVDIDGDLDLFVTSEEGTNRLFENDGTGHFRDITASSGLTSTGGGMCASFADVNGDGLPDLCVTFWNLPNKLYMNRTRNGKIHFEDVTQLTDINKIPAAKSNGVAFADINNDGYPDLFIASRNAENRLYMNDGKGNFRDKTHEYFKAENCISNGIVFADFDLDGYPDLYLTNVGDNVLYKNMDGKYFREVTAAFGAELSGYSTGCAVGDIDNDGDPDLYVANYINGNSKLFLNINERKSYIKFKLHGVQSNKDAIGAKIWVYKTGNQKNDRMLVGYREINGGSGYASVSSKEQIFGLNHETEYEALIKFPCSSDTIRLEHLKSGSTLNIAEADMMTAYYFGFISFIVRFFKNSENQPEIIKYLGIILMLIAFNFKHGKSNRSIDSLRLVFAISIFPVFIVTNNIYLYRWPSFTFFAAPLIAVGLLAIFYMYIERILLVRQGQKERQDLREKLSRDLHDDLASTLGSVSIYAETLKQMDHSASPEYNKLSAKIALLTQTALQSISDIIWMTSPRNDSLQSLISKINGYLYELLSDNNIGILSNIEVSDEPVILHEKIRNNLFLISKEALHNIIRHARASQVIFSAFIKDNQCTIIIQDNGVGFLNSEQKNKKSQGNGLLNMRRRSQESGIEFLISTPAQGGTVIKMQFKI